MNSIRVSCSFPLLWHPGSEMWSGWWLAAGGGRSGRLESNLPLAQWYHSHSLAAAGSLPPCLLLHSMMCCFVFKRQSYREKERNFNLAITGSPHK